MDLQVSQLRPHENFAYLYSVLSSLGNSSFLSENVVLVDREADSRTGVEADSSAVK